MLLVRGFGCLEVCIHGSRDPSGSVSYQEAIIPAVGVAVTVLPGLVKEDADEVDIGEDRPGLEAGRVVADKIREMMEELVESGML